MERRRGGRRGGGQEEGGGGNLNAFYILDRLVADREEELRNLRGVTRSRARPSLEGGRWASRSSWTPGVIKGKRVAFSASLPQRHEEDQSPGEAQHEVVDPAISARGGSIVRQHARARQETSSSSRRHPRAKTGELVSGVL